MKLVLDLTDMQTEAEWDETVAEIIKDEIESIVRLEVRAALKSQRAGLRAKIDKAVSSASREIQSHALKNLSDKLAVLEGKNG